MIGVLILIIVLDAYLYWVHRALHKYAPLWEIHKVHHSAYAPNFHLLEFTILWLIPMLIAWLSGYTASIFVISFLFVYEVTLTHRTVYATTNKVHRLLFRSLKFFLANAKYHKAHHDYPNRNFSQMFNVWDRVMGTMHQPKQSV
jgi:sterol desaturase/sphingolipid hydroxylase (fatty acid hydroxylase superfamily)